jgi:hypothetical protein
MRRVSRQSRRTAGFSDRKAPAGQHQIDAAIHTIATVVADFGHGNFLLDLAIFAMRRLSAPARAAP